MWTSQYITAIIILQHITAIIKNKRKMNIFDVKKAI